MNEGKWEAVPRSHFIEAAVVYADAYATTWLASQQNWGGCCAGGSADELFCQKFIKVGLDHGLLTRTEGTRLMVRRLGTLFELYLGIKGPVWGRLICLPLEGNVSEVMELRRNFGAELFLGVGFPLLLLEKLFDIGISDLVGVDLCIMAI